MDFETRIERAPILVLHFDCMELGQDGISYHKPEEFEMGPPELGGGVVEGGDGDSETYDEVDEERNKTRPVAGDSLRKVTEVYDEVWED